MPVTLRERLQALERERGDQHEARVDLESRIGDALLEVRRRRAYGGLGRGTRGSDWAPTVAEAAQLLGMSRQNAYRLLEQAERRSSP
jgi:hypothetical protein